MTSEDTLKVCELLVEQVGVKPEDAAKAINLWQVNMRTIDYPKAQEALKVLMMERANCKTAGSWLSAIIKHCGGSTQLSNQQRKEEQNPGCEKCQWSGCVEVPHFKDWNQGQWKGMYSMVVACECPAGQLKACQMQTIRWYEGMFPQWQYEFPRRRYEMQMRDMDGKEQPKTKAEASMYRDRVARLRSELDFLDGEVAEFEVSR